jgi:hypothetical protein
LPVEFFYSNRCSHCHGIKNEYLPELKSKYADKIAINYHNVAYPDEFAYQLALEKEYATLDSSIPVIFLPTTEFRGEYDIRNRLEKNIDELLDKRIMPATRKVVTGKGLIIDTFSRFSPAVVAFAGLADGINPCAFTTLIFFVTFLTLYSYSRKNIFIAGLSFITAIFLTYLLLGIGGMAIIGKVEKFGLLSNILKYVIGAFAAVLGVLAVYDYIIFKKTKKSDGLKLQLPLFIKTIMHKHIGSVYRKNSSFSGFPMKLALVAFISGVFISMLESVCTGQVYLPTITFVMKVPGLRANAFLYLIIYNLFFILPLLAIFLLAYKGVTSERFMKLTSEHLGVIKIIYALLFFGFAVFLLI